MKSPGRPRKIEKTNNKSPNNSPSVVHKSPSSSRKSPSLRMKSPLFTKKSQSYSLESPPRSIEEKKYLVKEEPRSPQLEARSPKAETRSPKAKPFTRKNEPHSVRGVSVPHLNDPRYTNAKKGLSEKQGGMNIHEFRKTLFKEYADVTVLIMNREQLNKFSKQHYENVETQFEKEKQLKKQLEYVEPYRKPRKTTNKRINPWDKVPVSKVKDLNEKQLKYCRCVGEVTIKNQMKTDSKRVNPYAVCHASVKGSGGRFKCPPKEKVLMTG